MPWRIEGGTSTATAKTARTKPYAFACSPRSAGSVPARFRQCSSRNRLTMNRTASSSVLGNSDTGGHHRISVGDVPEHGEAGHEQIGAAARVHHLPATEQVRRRALDHELLGEAI